MSSAREMQTWIQREFAIDGVLAAGGGRDLAQGFSSLATGELVLAGDAEVWRAIANAVARLQATGMPVEELLWGFEQAVLCTVQRADGAWLGVFTVPKLKDASALALRAKLDAFKAREFEEK
jgi:hypothetical protein